MLVRRAGAGWAITGVIDWERAFYGDPLAEVVSLAFHPKELPGRNVVELGLDATVNGDYKGVVRFLNGLQRSKNFYIIDTLTVAAEPTAQAGAGPLRVALSLRSYFKNAA